MRIIKNCIICRTEFSFRNAPSDVASGGGLYCSKKCQNSNMSKVLKERGIHPKERFVAFGEDNHAWRGDVASYSAKHYWLIRQLGRPRKCGHCGTTTAKKYEWANLSGSYERNITDWIRLCTSCHRLMDGHAKKAWATRRSRSA